jgi:hypothetical protein
MPKLSEAEINLLQAIAGGQTLKSHRYLDGSKVYQLHSPDGSIEAVTDQIVQALQAKHLIDDNKKFPAATYWLTEEGKHRLTGT